MPSLRDLTEFQPTFFESSSGRLHWDSDCARRLSRPGQLHPVVHTSSFRVPPAGVHTSHWRYDDCPYKNWVQTVPWLMQNRHQRFCYEGLRGREQLKGPEKTNRTKQSIFFYLHPGNG